MKVYNFDKTKELTEFDNELGYLKRDMTENDIVYLYIPYTNEQLLENRKNKLRKQREIECFSIVNRGKLWYARLSQQQLNELNEWYYNWLDVTSTLIIPEKPSWLN